MLRIASFLVVTCFIGSAFAQTLPDGGFLLENQKQREQLRQRPQQFPQIKPDEDKKKKTTPSQKIFVKGFKFAGKISAFSDKELHSLVDDAIGHSYDLDGLRKIVARVTDHYRKAGYFLAKAYLPPQDITEGVITIAIQEGFLDTDSDGVKIQGDNLRIKKNFAKNFIHYEVTPGKPIKQQQLERAVLILNDLPGIKASANLERGSDKGSSRIKLVLKEAAIVETTASIDNSANRYTGAERFSLFVNANDLSGYGDQITLSANTGNSNNNYLSVGYKTPAGNSGLKLGVNYSYLNYLLGKELKALNAKGTAENITLNLSYPVYRSRIQSFYFNAAYDKKNYIDKANGATISDKSIDVLSIFFRGERFDNFYDGGINQAQLQLKAGDLDLSNEPSSLAADKAITGSQRSGAYTKLVYSFSRLQKAGDDLVFYASVNGQVANKNLDSSERLQMGGPTGVRAYPVGEASVDEGYKLTVESRYTIKRATYFGDIQVIAFYDKAELQQFHNVGGQVLNTPNEFDISGWGIGLNIIKNSKYYINASWARKIGDNPLRDPLTGLDADGLDDKSRFWFTASLSF